MIGRWNDGKRISFSVNEQPILKRNVFEFQIPLVARFSHGSVRTEDRRQF